jgi:DNA helicase IV
MLDHSARLHISGGPGTGKTLLSRALCERRAPALYLCWTRALAAAVRASGIADAWTVREYAAHLLERAGVPVAGGALRGAWEQDVWESIALHAAVDAVPAERAHRIVVVDEAQDFAESEWELVKALAGDGALWAFGDAGQSFWAERGVPKGLFGAELALTARYRSPEGLATFAELYRSAPASAATATPAPRPARCAELRVVAVPGDTAAVLGRVRVELVRALKDGAKPGDIAILSLVGQSKSQLLKEARVDDARLVRADAPDAADHVVADTFLRFKGLERPYVIVTELSAGPERYDVRMHVALTRATLACVVVGTEEELARDARLASQMPLTTRSDAR